MDAKVDSDEMADYVREPGSRP